VSTGQRTVAKTIEIEPSISLDHAIGTVGEPVNVQLRGYGAGESVLVTFETGGGTRSMVRVTASLASGSADTSFVVPGSTHGKHRVLATGSIGNLAYASFWTRQSAWVSSGVPEPGRLVRIQCRGFVAGEQVEFRFDRQSGVELGSMVATDTGGGSLAVRIPASVPEGTHYVWLIGNRGTSARVSLIVSAAIEPTPTPTVAPTEAGTSTPVPVATPDPETPTELPPTELPPTVTGTATTSPPTETPVAETPTEPVSTVTPTEVPTVGPVVETATPSATDVNLEGT
jgi:hypothetical protein